MSSAPPSHWSEPFESDIVGRVGGAGTGGYWGAGDVAGVSLINGLSENVIDDGLDPPEEGGRESRVPSGEPSGVKTAGRSVVVDGRANRPCWLRSRGAARWDSLVMSYGCTVGGGVIRMVGTGGILGSLLVTVLGSGLGTRFSVLGSGLWKTEKTKLKRDRLKPPLSPRVAATDGQDGDQDNGKEEKR